MRACPVRMLRIPFESKGSRKGLETLMTGADILQYFYSDKNLEIYLTSPTARALDFCYTIYSSKPLMHDLATCLIPCYAGAVRFMISMNTTNGFYE